MRRLLPLLFVFAVLFALPASGLAADAPGQPPAVVVTASSESGKVLPRTEFVGTIGFPEISTVASEGEGRVISVRFEEGGRVKRGDVLVVVDADLLEMDLAAAKANLAKIESDLTNAKLELTRMSTLFDSKTVSEQSYDDARFSAQALSNQSASLKAEVERLRIRLAKTRVRAPFDGVVLARRTDQGEWLSAGTVVCELARDDVMDAYVDVPQSALPFIEVGQPSEVKVGDKVFQGKVFALVPLGDVKTRTFPVKVRIQGRNGLAQGMEARASLPTAGKVEAVLVPRDAVVPFYGQLVVWAAVQGKAVQIPVQVQAYDGSKAAVVGQGLEAGMQVVTKGNERLRPGQPLVSK